MSGHAYYLMEKHRGIRGRLSGVKYRSRPSGWKSERQHAVPSANPKRIQEEKLQLLRPVDARQKETFYGSSTCGHSVHWAATIREGCRKSPERQTPRQSPGKSGMDILLWKRTPRFRKRIEGSYRHQWRAKPEGQAKPAAGCRDTGLAWHRGGQTVSIAIRGKQDGYSNDTPRQTLVAEWPADLRVRQFPTDKATP